MSVHPHPPCRQIATQTSDAVTSEAKDQFYQQRKAVGDDTRSAMKDWKEDRVKQQGLHLDKAAQARAEALNAKRQANKANEDQPHPSPSPSPPPSPHHPPPSTRTRTCTQASQGGHRECQGGASTGGCQESGFAHP